MLENEDFHSCRNSESTSHSLMISQAATRSASSCVFNPIPTSKAHDLLTIWPTTSSTTRQRLSHTMPQQNLAVVVDNLDQDKIKRVSATLNPSRSI